MQQLLGLVKNQADAFVGSLKILLNVLKKELRVAEYHRFKVDLINPM